MLLLKDKCDATVEPGQWCPHPGLPRSQGQVTPGCTSPCLGSRVKMGEEGLPSTYDGLVIQEKINSCDYQALGSRNCVGLNISQLLVQIITLETRSENLDIKDKKRDRTFFSLFLFTLLDYLNCLLYCFLRYFIFLPKS